ncbi:hypothetical protein J051_4744 [Klebsiella pneumoniae 440_1540]|uniref:Uncharacterized protein n=1 Tax=Klebsiella pneumoniae IS43 TaxID=1432552 RepID=W1DNE0_KLEPN|nr:hypothetical protein CSC00_3505 [Klebsiella pneumoniae]EOR16139.1 hypothetical protein H208_0920 [Klebsiella pneumoniae UHKPC23]EOY67045.1 hypothetical protein H253_4246 [Klebsiella pneumoniae KP-7]EOY67917.1 hypothetical protein H207_2954 [Klebsiella pneumoniae UHKPC40]EOY81687.1 hypothetical protein H231_4606 [Klebsiella pneumoniae UHKPC01]EOY84981.1 hypothetical protein H230_0061 [Klebsiella pneumoniae UHKPC09]EOY93648.1 hypothetical protein H235_0060 [Klebsiella pneumoniae UHKPC24]EOY
MEVAHPGAVCVEIMNINTRKIPNFCVRSDERTIKQDEFLNNCL